MGGGLSRRKETREYGLSERGVHSSAEFEDQDKVLSTQTFLSMGFLREEGGVRLREGSSENSG